MPMGIFSQHNDKKPYQGMRLFTRDELGMNLLPMEEFSDGNVFPTRFDFQKISEFCSAIRGNIWPYYWAKYQPAMQQYLSYCKEFNLTFIFRAEDTTIFRCSAEQGLMDGYWWAAWYNYLHEILEYCSLLGLHVIVEVGNEPFNKQWRYRNHSGSLIGPEDFANLCASTARIIHSRWPQYKVINGGFTSIHDKSDELMWSDYDLVKHCIELKMFDFLDGFCYHNYGNLTFDDFIRIEQISFRVGKPVYITEANGDETTSQIQKLQALKQQWQIALYCFQNIKYFCPFVWKGSSLGILSNWTIADTELENFLRQIVMDGS